jgi:hypothetical protein
MLGEDLLPMELLASIQLLHVQGEELLQLLVLVSGAALIPE